MKRIAVTLTLALLSVALVGTYALAETQPSEDQSMKGYPEMHTALSNLEAAKTHLEKSRKIFGGHETKALELTKQAIAEVKAGLEYKEKGNK